MYKLLFSLAALALLGCPPSTNPRNPNPIPTPDSDLCGAMCEHIGPSGLKCPEGESVYDSDLPGPRDVPNKTCESFCEDQQAGGVFINPRCVMKVTGCDQIEAARQKQCD